MEEFLLESEDNLSAGGSDWEDENHWKQQMKAEYSAHLVIRGERDDSVVLCSDESTCEVKEMEASSTMLLMQDLIFPEDIPNTQEPAVSTKIVSQLLHHIFEANPTRPNMKRLEDLLMENPYRGKEHEKTDDEARDLGLHFYSFQDLLDRIQASEGELCGALQAIRACQINGYWRVLDFDYEFQVLSDILNYIEAESLSIDGIPHLATLGELEALKPREILEQVFSWYLEPSGLFSKSGEELFKLREKEVCCFLAQVLLRPTGIFNLEEFLSSWQQSVPPGKLFLLMIQ
ncbi:unnamed protein product [Darwinula stevensoni]|uniref:Sister chromatid cohesion protein DCC1 n=1 Tax=Darwinula stevensoni TaxID=69355 RepID=A0A7R8XDI8_9CRUS|nr:unnamed protein product [Darwinula stevensoni]CAG0894812.1 unnamed protein product [Darwinula stevensoni]